MEHTPVWTEMEHTPVWVLGEHLVAKRLYAILKLVRKKSSDDTRHQCNVLNIALLIWDNHRSINRRAYTCVQDMSVYIQISPRLCTRLSDGSLHSGCTIGTEAPLAISCSRWSDHPENNNIVLGDRAFTSHMLDLKHGTRGVGRLKKVGGQDFMICMFVSIHKICVRSRAFIQDFDPTGFLLYPRRVSSDLDPSSSQLGVWRSAVSFLSGVWGGAPAADDFGAF